MQLQDERFLREKEVCAMTGISRVTVWRWEKAKKFPSHYLLHGSIAVWKLSEITNWMNEFHPVTEQV